MARAYKCVSNRAKVKLLAANNAVTVTMLLATLAVSGCAIGSNAIEEGLPKSAASIADTAPTIAATPFDPSADTQDASANDRVLDEDTIRLAVTTADMSRIQAEGLPWANQATGSTGVITNIVQRNEGGQTCRSFDASRNAYDGVTLYQGDVCLDQRTGWWTRLLRPFGENA